MGMVLEVTEFNNGYGCSCCRRDWEETEWVDEDNISFESIVDQAFEANPYDHGVSGKTYEKNGKELYGFSSSINRAVCYKYIHFPDGTEKMIADSLKDDDRKRGALIKEEVLAFYEYNIKPKLAILDYVRKFTDYDYDQVEVKGNKFTLTYDMFATFDRFDSIEESIAGISKGICELYPYLKKVESSFDNKSDKGVIVFESEFNYEEEMKKAGKAAENAVEETKREKEAEEQRKREEQARIREENEKKEYERLKAKYEGDKIEQAN